VTCPDAVTYLEYCQLTGTDPAAAETDEVRVRALITAVTRGLELSCNCRFVRRAYVEEHLLPYAPMPYPRLSWDPAPVLQRLILKQRPVQAVAEVKDLEGTLIDPTTYQLIPDHAFLYRAQGWPQPEGGWLISVTGGHFPSTAEVAADVKQAVASLVKEGYETPGQIAPVTSESVGPVRVTYAQTMGVAVGFEALPPQVQVWLQPYVNVGGLGW
jgi:hypothetical protein